MIRFDSQKYIADLTRSMERAGREIGDLFLEFCKIELSNSAYPFRQEWIDEMILELKNDVYVASSGYVTAIAGLPDAKRKEDIMKRDVIEHGQIKPLMTKPGETVFGKYFENEHVSKAKTQYRIPEFEQEGLHWFEDAVAKFNIHINSLKEMVISNNMPNPLNYIIKG